MNRRSSLRGFFASAAAKRADLYRARLARWRQERRLSMKRAAVTRRAYIPAVIVQTAKATPLLSAMMLNRQPISGSQPWGYDEERIDSGEWEP